MNFSEIFFWIALFIVFYTYLGYGIILYILVKIKELFKRPQARPVPEDEHLPHLTLFITAYNEEAVVEEKMRNCLALKYPQDKLHIVWVTDGSNDHSVEMLQKWPQVTVYHQPLRMGKTAAMNRGMRFIETPLVVFTDANTELNPDCLLHIVQAFEDPKVGCVAGEKRIVNKAKANAAAGGEGMYWRYESALKALDSRLYSTCGAAGELFAIRRPLYIEMDSDTLLDDFVLSLRIVMQGYTIAYRSDAYAMEGGSADMMEEEKRKVRIAAGGLQSIARLWPLFNPFKYGIFSFQYVSHRVLRWSITPIMLFALLPVNVVLLWSSSPVLYSIIFLLQALFYLMGSWGYYLSRKHIKNKFLFIPYYFLFMNVNVFRGFSYLMKRKKGAGASGAWEKSKRA